MKETEAPEVESSDPNTAILEYVPKLETLEKSVANCRDISNLMPLNPMV